MTDQVAALVAHARSVPAERRHDLAERLRAARPSGTVLVETCHRVELYGAADEIDAARQGPGGIASVLAGDDAARHVIALAVGRESAVLAEDQVLHQLRVAVGAARSQGPLPPALDHLVDLALRAGRRARSWLPSRRPTLADVALDAGSAGSGTRGGPVLIVGAGEMGGLAARAATRRGHRVLVASRSRARAEALAEAVAGVVVPFVPAPADVDGLDGVLVALRGPWPIGPAVADALVGSDAWLVDLSAPPAVDPALRATLGPRFTSVDDLAVVDGSPPTPVVGRLDELIEVTLAEYRAWVARDPDRAAARALTDRSEEARTAELEALFRRTPSLDPEERAEIERMAERLVARLLRDPLERLGRDEDGRHRRAARELFGL